MKTVSHLESLQACLVNLPPLPAIVRYYDDFSDSYAEVIAPDNSDQWILSFDGRRTTLDFLSLDVEIRRIAKCWCAALLSRLSPVTAEFYFFRLAAIPIDRIVDLLTCKPQEVRAVWRLCHSSNLSPSAFVSLKSFVVFLCESRIGAWGPEWLDLVSQLPLPKIDKYASVRVGDVFLSAEEESKIIRHIDSVCANLQAQPAALSDDIVESTAILVCSYQFGFRAKQIAMLEMRSIRIWDDGLEGMPAVHLTFSMIKQRSAKRVFPMVRRVKREWATLFLELFDRAKAKGLAGADHVFRRTPRAVGEVIIGLTVNLLGGRRTVVELRHTAAQRLVDAGATEEELATFMGHSDLNTGLIYFRSSPSQGERINRALGLSKVYQRIVKIAHDRFISLKELAELKGEQQIAGVPHGIPIAGIGGCSHGQPSCPYNPIMSCYGCTRFMPVADVDVHQRVLEDLRRVVKVFYESSRAERGSPAFQLEQTISSVQAILDELEHFQS